MIFEDRKCLFQEGGVRWSKSISATWFIEWHLNEAQDTSGEIGSRSLGVPAEAFLCWWYKQGTKGEEPGCERWETSPSHFTLMSWLLPTQSTVLWQRKYYTSAEPSQWRNHEFNIITPSWLDMLMLLEGFIHPSSSFVCKRSDAKNADGLIYPFSDICC